MIKLALKIAPRWVKNCVIRFKYHSFRSEFKKRSKDLQKEHNNIIYIIATPEHGNLGDQAIVYAELQILEDLDLNSVVIEIPNLFYLHNKKFIASLIRESDTIIIDGGGNLGTLWPWEDDKITGIIETYKKNKIVIFPQTCFYDSTTESRQRLEENITVYSQAQNLTITLRDQKSYDYCKQNFPENVKLLLIPDIVLYLNNVCSKKEVARDGVLLCLRKDLERVMTSEDAEKLKQTLHYKGIAYQETSTLVDYSVNSFSRKAELFKKWEEFASAKLIITDRLHGMIFAIISGTPCLAMDNLSRKVSGVYNITNVVDSVKICADIDEVINSIECYYNDYQKDTIGKSRKADYTELINKIKQ